MNKALVAGNKNPKALVFSRPQQFTVCQPSPSHVRGGNDLMSPEHAQAGSHLVR